MQLKTPIERRLRKSSRSTSKRANCFGPGVASWQEIKATDLKKINESLKSHGISEIQVSQLEKQADESLAR